jgi:NAD(P)-dependent dehydrogenase (short-subunit alcohol dehydrogenase family)
MRFDGKVGIFRGGASRIGEGIVRRLVAEGGRCLIADAASEVPGAKARRYFEGPTC